VGPGLERSDGPSVTAATRGLTRTGLMPWDLESPTIVGVLRFLERAGGGAHLSVSRAFAGARSRVTYVLLWPPSAGLHAAFLWPTAATMDDVLHASTVGRPAAWPDECCRPMEIGVRVIEIDTYLAPRVLPGWLRPRLLASMQCRVLRVCRCLLMRRMDTPCPYVTLGARLASLLGVPIQGPGLRAALS